MIIISHQGTALVVGGERQHTSVFFEGSRTRINGGRCADASDRRRAGLLSRANCRLLEQRPQATHHGGHARSASDDHGDARRHTGPRRRPRRVLAPSPHSAADHPGLGRPRLCRPRGLARELSGSPCASPPAPKAPRASSYCPAVGRSSAGANARRNARDYGRLPQHSKPTGAGHSSP